MLDQVERKLPEQIHRLRSDWPARGKGFLVSPAGAETTVASFTPHLYSLSYSLCGKIGTIAPDCETRMNSDPPSAQPGRAEWFASTHWSVVLAAKEGDPATASAALEQLCRTYWPPLYAFIRREGYGEAEAKDLTQEFFLRLINREFLQRLRHQQGKFRSFLLTFLKHFLLEERGKAGAQKRGGGKPILSLEQLAEEGTFLSEPVDHFSPDQVFERRWAQTIFQVALNRLREEYAAGGNADLYDLLKDVQPRERGAPSYAEIGARFGMTEAAVKSAAQRMRARHREILRQEIAKTVMRPDEIEEEIRHVREVLSGSVG